MRKVLVLGGAGFVGSWITERFCRAGDHVTVIDGLMPRTGGRAENLKKVADQITFIREAVEAVEGLPDLISDNNVIVDAMGWTAHNSAIENQLYDAQLNCLSHLHVIPHLVGRDDLQLIYLGTRVQYGRPDTAVVTESAPLVPVDVQGIHKVAGESYYRVFSERMGFNAVSLRLSNCYGERQPKTGEDIGLVGGFIRSLVEGERVEVYEGGRKRCLIYAGDLAELVLQLCEIGWRGFSVFNYAGLTVSVEDLVDAIIQHTGCGSYEKKPLPDSVARLEMGNVDYNDAALASFLGEITSTPLGESLARTVEYFRSED
jgi:UDP-glucose 4-epimerase